VSAIHDLGYKRYVGTRRPTSTRWRVIVRRQMATAWHGWFRMKAAVGLAIVTTCVFGGMMYFLTNGIMFRGFRRVGDLPLTIADGALPASLDWYRRAAFLLGLTVIAGAVAGDRQSGAFTFYFARSIRPRDYVAGKLGGALAMTASILVLGPLVLALLRLGLCDDTDALVAHLAIVPEALAIGALATLVYAIVPLGISALFASRRYAVAVWAAYWLIATTAAGRIGIATGSSWIAALDLARAIEAVTHRLFDLQLAHHLAIPLPAALGSIALHVALALAIVGYQVARAQRTGVGGSA